MPSQHRPQPQRIELLLTAPWAVLPETLAEIQRIYALHLRGETIDLQAVEASLGRPLANAQQQYEVRPGGVAVLSVSGVMAPKANMMTDISGGVSTQMLARQFGAMKGDSRVQSAVIAWDSPGGNVLGIPAAAEALRALADAKPTVSVSEGTMASAAYWVGSAANTVYIEGETDQVGSLGVYQRMSWDPQAPNTMELVRGKYKRASLNGEAPSPEMLAYQEGQMDHLYTVLVDAVAASRGVTSAQVLDHMADGRVFLGRQAIAAGLADGFSTVDAMVEQLATKPGDFARRRVAQFALGGLPSAQAAATVQAHAADTPLKETTPMSKILTEAALALDPAAFCAALASEHPTLAACLQAAGATAERERIQAVMAQDYPGHTALVQQLAFDGKTTGPEAAMAVLGAERAANQGRAANILADRPAPVAADATGTADDDTTTMAAAPVATPISKAHDLRDAIVKKQAEASAAGRTISAVQALAIVTKEQANG